MKRIVFLLVVAFSVLALAESHGYHRVLNESRGAASLRELSLADENLLYSAIGSTVLSAGDEGFQYAQRDGCDLSCPNALEGDVYLPAKIR
jgi:hypothetical protein